MDDSNQRKNGAILSYISIIITTLVQLLYTPLLIKKLGQSEYGLYSLVNSIIGYLTVLDLGFGNAIIVHTAKYRAKGDKNSEQKLHGMFRRVFLFIGAIAGILGIILFTNVDILFQNTMNTEELQKTKIMMLILTFNLIISFTFSIYSSIISAYEKFVFQKIMAIISTILKPLIIIPLLFLGFKSITMTIVITLINVLVLFSNYLYCKSKLNIRIKYNGFDKVLFKTILGYSLWIFLGVIVDKINWNVDQFILGAVSGTIAVSIYSIAGQINNLFINLSTAISGVLLPKMSKIIENGATCEELTDEMIKAGRIQFYIVFFMISGIILLGKEFIIYWAGEEYSNSYYCLLFLSIPETIPLIQNLGISIRQAMNKHKFATLVNIFIALINVVVSIFLAKKYGPIGSAIGTGIGIIISIFIINLYYNYNINLKMAKFWKNIIRISIPCIIPIIIIIVIIKVTSISGIESVIIYGIIYTVLYCCTVYYFSMNNYEKDIVKRLLKRKRDK